MDKSRARFNEALEIILKSWSEDPVTFRENSAR